MSIQQPEFKSYKEIPKPFQSQQKKMEKNLQRAQKNNDTQRIQIWTNKIKDLQSKIEKLDSETLKKIEKDRNKFSNILNRIYKKTNFIYRNCIHPALSSFDSAKIKKIESIPQKEIKNYRVLKLVNHQKFLDCITEQGKYRPPESKEELMERLEFFGNKEIQRLVRHVDFDELIQVLNGIEPSNAKVEDVIGELNKHFKVNEKDQEILTIAENRNEVETLIDEGKATQLHFYNSKLDQLEALVIHPTSPTGEVLKTTSKKLILAGGNVSSSESSLALAQQLADKYQVDVIIYNGPGMMYSMGREDSTEDAVDAFQSLYQEVLQRDSHPENIAVIGHSLGGGIATNGLAKIDGDKKPGLFINFHSFSSLSRVGGGIFFDTNTGEVITKFILRVLKTGNLNSARAIKSKTLANKVVVVHTPTDGILRGRGQLAAWFREKEAKPEVTIQTEVDEFAKETKGWFQRFKNGMTMHNDSSVLTRSMFSNGVNASELGSAMHEWLTGEKPPELGNFAKDIIRRALAAPQPNPEEEPEREISE